MKQESYFLSEIFPADDSVLLKFIDLETGDSFKKHVSDILSDPIFINKVIPRDKAAVRRLVELETEK